MSNLSETVLYSLVDKRYNERCGNEWWDLNFESSDRSQTFWRTWQPVEAHFNQSQLPKIGFVCGQQWIDAHTSET